ncbi:MAG: DUF6622 family protein [Caldimonas sp.]
MPSDIPFSVLVVEIVRHTPTYAWVILAALVKLGAMQLRDHHISRLRLALAPIGLGAFSLWGATAAFGGRLEVVGAWLLGGALAVLANRWLQWPRNVRADANGGFAVGGSPWPLALMISIFLLRYAVAVTLAFHHELARDPLFGTGMACLYGALSGLFAARALRILGSASKASGYVTA